MTEKKKDMINVTLILENPEQVAEAAKNKGITLDITSIKLLVTQHKDLLIKVQKLREERNKIAKSRDIEAGKQIKQELEKEEEALKKSHENLHALLATIPNLPKSDVKVGKDESENEVIKKHKEPTKFTFQPKDHVALGEALDIIDVERAAKVSGPRFGYLKNDAVLLEFALVQLALEVLIKEGFMPVVPPVLIKQPVMKGMGYMEHGGSEDMFQLTKDNLVLVGTAEHAIVPMHMDEILQGSELPKRYVGFSTAFRREAGSYGKDTRGIIRVHQFDKVEMVSYVAQGDDDREHEYLLSLEEKLFQLLDIPYQVIKMCTGDLGFPTARKYDIEAWIPSQNTYREVTSASTITDFQSRRLNIKYKDGEQKKLTNVLNGTAFAIGRTIVAILENYQQEDGSVKVPEVLQKYVGKTIINQKGKK